MTKEEIIRMAREAGLGTALCHNSVEGDRVWIEGADWHDELERFAALVAAHKAEVALAEAYRCGHEDGVVGERQRIVNLLMIQHEAAKGAHNYWHVAAQLIQADVASDT